MSSPGTPNVIVSKTLLSHPSPSLARPSQLAKTELLDDTEALLAELERRAATEAQLDSMQDFTRPPWWPGARRLVAVLAAGLCGAALWAGFSSPDATQTPRAEIAASPAPTPHVATEAPPALPPPRKSTRPAGQAKQRERKPASKPAPAQPRLAHDDDPLSTRT
jgi:hypothetical protein